NRLVVVDVDLCDLQPPGIFLCDLVQGGCDHLARAAPFRPEIHQHGGAGFEYLGLERLVTDVNYMLAHGMWGRSMLGLRLGAARCDRALCYPNSVAVERNDAPRSGPVPIC